MRPTYFEYGCLSTVTTSDNIMSKIQWFQNQFIRLALRLPKYISPKLLHDSASHPYVKDRPISLKKTLNGRAYLLNVLNNYSNYQSLEGNSSPVFFCGLFFKTKLKRSLAPDVISLAPVAGSSKFKHRLEAEKFCISCIELIFKFLSQ